MQCKDIPDEPILRFIIASPGWKHWYGKNELTLDGAGDWYAKSVRNAMPEGVPDKLVLGKMRQLIRRGLVDGCDCGCRGDFELTEKGEQWLDQRQIMAGATAVQGQPPAPGTP